MQQNGNLATFFNIFSENIFLDKYLLYICLEMVDIFSKKSVKKLVILPKK